jgi:hypothetical protein
MKLKIITKLKIANYLMKEIKSCTDCGKLTHKVGLNTHYRNGLFPTIEHLNLPCCKCPKCMQICYNKHKKFYQNIPERLRGWALEAVDEMDCLKNLKEIELKSYLDEDCYDKDIQELMDCWVYLEDSIRNDIVDLIEFFEINDKNKNL